MGFWEQKLALAVDPSSNFRNNDRLYRGGNPINIKRDYRYSTVCTRKVISIRKYAVFFFFLLLLAKIS